MAEKLNFTDGGFFIAAQDLSAATPSSDDHRRVFNHDGSSSLTLTDGSTTTRQGWYMWDNNSSAWFPMGQHADLVDGYHGADLAALAENETVGGSWTFNAAPSVPANSFGENDLDFAEQPISISHTKWSDGLSNEEIARFELNTGEVLEAHRLDLQLKGGGSLTTPSNFTIELYDVTNAAVIASDSADGTPTTGDPIATSGSGATVILRMTNSSGSYQIAGIEGRLHIV